MLACIGCGCGSLLLYSKNRIRELDLIDLEAPFTASFANEAGIFAYTTQSAFAQISFSVVGDDVQLATGRCSHAERLLDEAIDFVLIGSRAVKIMRRTLAYFKLPICQKAPTDATCAPTSPVCPAAHACFGLVPHKDAARLNEVCSLRFEQASIDATGWWRCIGRSLR